MNGQLVDHVEDDRPADGELVIISPLAASLPWELGEIACALPVGDANGTLLEALNGERPGSGVFAGMLVHDPFRRTDDLLDALCERGVAGVVNWPSVGALDGETASALAHSGFRYADELAFLQQASSRGLHTAVRIHDIGQLEAALEIGPSGLIVAPGAQAAPGSDPNALPDGMAAVLDAVDTLGDVQAWAYLPGNTNDVDRLLPPSVGVIRHAGPPSRADDPAPVYY